MKKIIMLFISATLILSLAACKNDYDPYDSVPLPSSKPSNSENESQSDTTSNTQSDNNSQNNSQIDHQKPPVVEDTNKEDITAYVPYGLTDNENNSQYYPPEMDSTGGLGMGVTAEGKKFEVPEFFEVEKAIRLCKSQNPTVTIEKLSEFANEYAKAYNNYYKNSNYKLAVSVSGNVIKYTFTVSGKPAEKSNAIIKHYIDNHFKDNADFYKAQVKKYKNAVSSIEGIEISIVRTDSTNVITKKFS